MQSQLSHAPGTCLAIPRRDPNTITATLRTWYPFVYSLMRFRCSHSYPTNLVCVFLFLDEIQLQSQVPYKPGTCLAIPRRDPDAVTATLQTWYQVCRVAVTASGSRLGIVKQVPGLYTSCDCIWISSRNSQTGTRFVG